MADAIRHPKRGKAHRPVWSSVPWGHDGTFVATACDRLIEADLKGLDERVPLDQTAPEDRCKRCFPSLSPEE